MAKHKHYVNLHRKDVFVERGVDSKDRLGPVFFKLKFKKSDSMAASLRTVKVSETAPYTDAEKKRNFDFQLHEPLGLEVSEGEEVEAKGVALLPPAGGAVYKFEARAGDKTVATSDEVETWRRLYFQVFHMKDVKVPDLGPTINYYRDELFVELLDHPEKSQTELAHVECATSSDLTYLLKSSKSYKLKDYEPWAMALVFAHMLPKLRQIEIDGQAHGGKVSLPSRWSGNEELEFDLPYGMFVWFGVNSVDDAENGGKGIWLRGDGKLAVDGKEVVVPADSITLDKSKTYRAGKGFSRLKIKLPEDARNQNRLFGKDAVLTLTLWVIDGFSGGFAMRDENLLTVSKTAWWSDKEDTENEKLQVLNHEFGHKLGMVPKGGREFGSLKELDAPDKLYGDFDFVYAPRNASDDLKERLKKDNNAKGHTGAHCERGVKAKKKGDRWKWSGKPECTMFGATGTEDAPAPQKFCSVCKMLVIRQDLDTDRVLPGFKSIIGK